MRTQATQCAGILAIGVGTASGQSFNFEPPYPASTTGTAITGTDGWYQPAVAGTGPVLVFPYTGNAPGMPPNPEGAAQFAAGLSGGGLTPRAQHDIGFAAGGIWQMEYDFAVAWAGNPPAADFIGSISLQDSQTTRAFQVTMAWGQQPIGPAPNATSHAAAPVKFHHAVGHYTTAFPNSLSHFTPSPAWRDLLVNHWYHARVKWDFDSSAILECAIRDVSAGGPAQVTDVSANAWWLRAGPTSTLPLPTAVRVFTGSTANVLAVDNLKVAKATPCYPDCNTDGQLSVADFGCFQTRFVLADLYADCTFDGQLNVPDFGCFQTRFVAGCP